MEDGQGTQTEKLLVRGSLAEGRFDKHPFKSREQKKKKSREQHRKAAYSVGLKESVEQSSVEGKSSLTAHSSLRVRTQAAVSISLLSN